MKTNRATGSPSVAGLTSLVLIYIVLIILILFFSTQVLKDISRASTLSSFIVVPIALLLPLFVMGMLVVNIVRLARERRSGQPGARFKIRLIVFFTFVAFLSSVPQGILSISFINTTMNSWFSTPTRTALQGGIDIALEFVNDRLTNLTTFGDSDVLAFILRDIDRSPDRVWTNIHGADPAVSAVQVFDESGKELYFRGQTAAQIKGALEVNREDGVLPKESYGNISVLRFLKNYRLDGKRYAVVLSALLPNGFDQKAQALTASREIFTQLDRFGTIFRLVLVIFFSVFSFPMLLLSILVSFLLSEEIMRPIVNLEEATRRVAEGDFSYRILGRASDELSMLVSSFNRMVSELERSRLKLLQTEKVTAWQEIAQRLAHEIKNPLTPIKLSAQRILRKAQTDPANLERIVETSVQAIINEVDNLDRLLREFRDFSRLPAPTLADVDLRRLVNEVAEVHAAPYKSIQFRMEEIPEGLILKADKTQLKQVFINLFKNAFEAIDGEGRVTVRADLVRKGNTQYCRIQVRDTGRGIGEEYQNQVFNPYFTTKGAGTGLGLPIVERIIVDHKGQIWFETQERVGTTFFIDLPME
ncbi:MAG TPA: ATP-binding protein [Spirochaetia bacterium]|nr:ATP-binding protein [Spirochaetia bacterium]